MLLTLKVEHKSWVHFPLGAETPNMPDHSTKGYGDQAAPGTDIDPIELDLVIDLTGDRDPGCEVPTPGDAAEERPGIDPGLSLPRSGYACWSAAESAARVLRRRCYSPMVGSTGRGRTGEDTIRELVVWP